MPDFPDRNVDGATGLFSEQAGKNLNGEFLDYDWTGISQSITVLQNAWADVQGFVSGKTPVPAVELPELVPEDEDDDCEKLVIAVREITHTLARTNTILISGFAALNLAQAAQVVSQSRIQQSVMTRLPHKDFQKGAAIDLQHHIRDGFDAVAQVLAQGTEARTGKKIVGADLPELKYTDPKLDKIEYGKAPDVIVKPEVKAPKEGDFNNGRP